MNGVGLLLGGSVLIALVIALAGSRAIRFTRWLALGAPLLAIGLALQHFGAGDEPTASPAPFVALSDRMHVAWLLPDAFEVGYVLDTAAAAMLVVVGVVAAMVVIFSFGYMAEDRSQARYFALLSAFTGAMSALVLADSLLGLFIAWELVGACSYLLIGFWFTKASAARAAMKAFLVTRVGDVGLLFGLALLWSQVGTLRLDGVVEALPGLSAATVTTAALLLFVGAAGKSAQFPLHVWLPDAMEGPTPVSALIHAATMVAAGVFLVIRTWPVFEASPQAMAVVLAIGCVTAVGAAGAALAQQDIKRVLAYSTISQLGFMFAALGVGAWQAAFFHLVTHAAFKSLLFLTSGSIIHGSGTQDLREMGGLRKAMPLTSVAWIVGIAALSGLPPLSGFFSKDAVLDAAWQASPLAAVALFIASAGTALYAFRATRLALAGDFRGQGHVHESPFSMTLPLVVLAVLAAALGLAQGWFAEAFGGHAELSLPIAAASSVLALGFAVLGWRLGAPARAEGPESCRRASAWRVLASAYGVDTVVMRAARWTQGTLARGAAAFDGTVIDGAVRGVAQAGSSVGSWFTSLQSGEGSLYAAYIAIGAAMLLGVALWMGW